MKLSVSMKAFVFVLAMAPFGFVSGAQAYDDDNDGRDVAVGIIGEVISGAVRGEDNDDYDGDDRPRRCERLQYRCSEGSDWACRKFEQRCGD